MTHKMPAVQKEVDAASNSKAWWIENPEALPPTDPSRLCIVCRHINFRYLLSSPPRQLLEKVPLGSFEQIVRKIECSFCRLVSHTVQLAFEGEKFPIEFDVEKRMACELQVLPIDGSSNGPRQLCIYLDRLPKGTSIDASKDLLIHGIEDGWNQNNEGEKQKTITMSRMNISTIKHWYSTCLDGECGGRSSPNPSVSLPGEFRLIDVHEMRIVGGNNTSRYLALSYVWGHSETLQNTKGVRSHLEREAGLSERLERLPDTIKDAIEFVRELGERYLWVDSLCIIQDDDEDKGLQITAMDSIYGSAILTIAAASGSNADAGLPGWRSKLRTFAQLVESVQGLSLTNRPPIFDKSIDQSSWNTRAWTFQERVLSRRVLYIADQRCFFTCCHRLDAFMESVDSTESGLLEKRVPVLLSDYSRNLVPASHAVNILSYSRTVADYTSRNLTYPSDILRAFEGVASRFRPLFRSDFLFGLPRSELDSQILWQPQGPMTRRRDPESGLPIFPSWSWAGWVGEVRCNTHENLSRIQWVGGEDGKGFSSEDSRYPTDVDQDPVKRIFYRCQWKSGLDEKGDPYYWEIKNPDHYFRHPTAREHERSIRPHLKPGTTDHIEFEAEVTNKFWLGLGHYLTMALYFHKCTPEHHTVCPLPLRDMDGYIAGYVLVPGDVAIKLNAEARYETIMLSRTKISSLQRGRGDGNPDLLVDSEATTLEKQYFPDRPHVDVSTTGYGFDEQRFDGEKLWCLYNIMIVEVMEGGVAYRVGVGTVHIDAWSRVGAERKVVVLG